LSGNTVVTENSKSFINLGTENRFVFDDVDNFGNIHFEEHTSDLGSLRLMNGLNLDEETFAESVLLFFGRHLAEFLERRKSRVVVARVLVVVVTRVLVVVVVVLVVIVVVVVLVVVVIVVVVTTGTTVVVVTTLLLTRETIRRHGTGHTREATGEATRRHGHTVGSHHGRRHVGGHTVAATHGGTRKVHVGGHVVHAGATAGTTVVATEVTGVVSGHAIRHHVVAGSTTHGTRSTSTTHSGSLNTVAGLLFEHLDTGITVLSDGDVEGTSADDLVVEFTLSVGSGFLLFEDDETVTLGGTGVGEASDGASGDSTVGAEELLESFVSHGVIEVLDVEVLTLVLDEGLLSGKSLGGGTFLLGLGASNVELGVLGGEFVFLFVEGFDGLHGTFVRVHFNKGELSVEGRLEVEEGFNLEGFGFEGVEELDELVNLDVGGEVLDVHVSEGFLGFLFTFGALLEEFNGDGLATNGELILFSEFDSLVGVGRVVEVDETVVARLAGVIEGELAGGDGANGGEGFEEHARSDGVIEVLDEEVTSTHLAGGGVTLRPRDTDGLAGDDFGEGKLLEGLFGVGLVLEVDVTVTEETLSMHVTASLGGDDGTDLTEVTIQGVFDIFDVLGEIRNEESSLVSSRSRSSSSHFCFVL